MECTLMKFKGIWQKIYRKSRCIKVLSVHYKIKRRKSRYDFRLLLTYCIVSESHTDIPK